MLCQYCKKANSVLRRLTDSEFCSAAHRTAYKTEQQRLAVMWLREHRRPQAKDPEPAPAPGIAVRALSTELSGLKINLDNGEAGHKETLGGLLPLAFPGPFPLYILSAAAAVIPFPRAAARLPEAAVHAASSPALALAARLLPILPSSMAHCVQQHGKMASPIHSALSVRIRSTPIQFGHFPICRTMFAVPCPYGAQGGIPAARQLAAEAVVLRPLLPKASIRTLCLLAGPLRHAGEAENSLASGLPNLAMGSADRLWRSAPADLKWIALGFPLILGLYLWSRPEAPPPRSHHMAIETEATDPSSLDAPDVTAPARAEPAITLVSKSLGERGSEFEKKISKRAVIEFEEDFRSGLTQWGGRFDWSRTWSYNRAGLVRPGALALFQPSLEMTNYVFEMKGSIEQGGLSWAVRASDLRNYRAFRLLSTGGIQPRFTLERWAVHEGRPGHVTRTPVTLGFRNQMTVRVRVELRDASITTYLQDQVADTFNDPSLPKGGIGLFSQSGDQARVYDLRLSHQNDFWGKLCSFIAPHPITTAGSTRE